MTIKKHAASFLREESGLAMVEYAVAGTLVTLAAVYAFSALGLAVWVRILEIAAVLGLG
jgi:pilus assembly protein Flp/PilA